MGCERVAVCAATAVRSARAACSHRGRSCNTSVIFINCFSKVRLSKSGARQMCIVSVPKPRLHRWRPETQLVMIRECGPITGKMQGRILQVAMPCAPKQRRCSTCSSMPEHAKLLETPLPQSSRHLKAYMPHFPISPVLQDIAHCIRRSHCTLQDKAKSHCTTQGWGTEQFQMWHAPGRQ